MSGEPTDSTQIYLIDGGEPPWGDYGDILIHGMSAHLGRNADGTIQLERTAPFIPPITFPGIDDIVVTSEMKAAMEAEGLRGVSFKPVDKTLIVDVPWHTWDLDAEDPPYYPEDGEPEGFILDKPHSPELAEQLGEIWEVVLEDGAEMKRAEMNDDTTWDSHFYYVEGSWNGNDLFTVEENRYMYASARAKLWFEENYPKWTSFKNGNRH